MKKYSTSQIKAFAKKNDYVLHRSSSGIYTLSTPEGRFIAEVLGTIGAGFAAYTNHPHGLLSLDLA